MATDTDTDTCDAHIYMGPHWTFDAEDGVIDCTEPHEGAEHATVMSSGTRLTWFEDDRRCFHGEFPGACSKLATCPLPDGHPRGCAE